MGKEEKKSGQGTLMSESIIAQREKMYEKANAPAEKPTATPAAPEVKPPAANLPPATPPTPAPAPGSKEPVAPTPPVVSPDPGAKPAGTPQPEKKEDDRKVPLEALHESREKLKAKEKELNDLKEQNQVLLKDLRELMTKPSAASEEPPVVTDYDKKLFELEKELKELREKDKQRETQTAEEKQKQAIQQAQQEFKQTVDSLDKSLEAEGFAGLKKFLPLVTAELFRIAETEGKEVATKMDNPEGWKQIFKDIVHPEITGFGKIKSADEKVKEKEALKEGASLLMPAGNPPAPPAPKEDDWSYEKYLEERNKRSPQPQARRK